MFKLVFVFGLTLVSASGEDTFHSKLSSSQCSLLKSSFTVTSNNIYLDGLTFVEKVIRTKYAEPGTPSNQTNQIKNEFSGKPTTDSFKTEQQKRPNHHDQRTQKGNESFIRFSKWSPTDYSCPTSVKGPVAVQGQQIGDPNKFEKAVELKSSHPEEKRQPTRHNLGLNLLEDWMEDRVKISHISHIYIGEAMYPYIYEESRVFITDPPQPSSGGENPNLKEVMSESKHKKEGEVPIYEITKIYEIK